MAVLEILKYPDERLKRVSAPVSVFDDELRRFVAELEQTMAAGPAAVGIAAPQVGRVQRIVIVDVSGRPGTRSSGHMVLINPQILRREGEAIGREGCLSVPDCTGNVARAQRIELAAMNESGQRREYLCEGFEARAVQHEIDHLDGILFLHRLTGKRDLFRRKVYKS